MKLNTLKNNFEFLRAYRSRNCCVSPLIVTYVVWRRRGGVRLGITTGKKVGCAVDRNRARRVVRAAATQLLAGISANCDIVVVCRRATANAKSTDVAAVMQEHLRQTGVLT